MLAAAVVLSAQWTWGQINEEVNTRPDAYSVDQSFFKLPEGRTIGSTVGINLDRDGRSIWVFERCGGNVCVGSDLAPILKFDASGNLVKSFGADMFVRPHAIHIDVDGNVWVSDHEDRTGSIRGETVRGTRSSSSTRTANS